MYICFIYYYILFTCVYIYTYITGIFLLNRKKCLKCSSKEKLFYTSWYNHTIDNYGSIENYIIENYLIQWEKRYLYFISKNKLKTVLTAWLYFCHQNLR